MVEAPAAFLSHRCPGRARLKFGAHRGDQQFFTTLTQQMAEVPGIIGVSANALTASLLILHEGSLEDVLAEASVRGLLRLVEEAEFARSRFAEPDELSLRQLATIALFTLGVVQVLRGYALGPASGLFAMVWHLTRDRDRRRAAAGVGPG